MQQEDMAFDAQDTLPSEPDDVDEVLATLRSLLAKASNPIVRACLEDACNDIAHLTGRDSGLEEQTEVA